MHKDISHKSEIKLYYNKECIKNNNITWAKFINPSNFDYVHIKWSFIFMILEWCTFSDKLYAKTFNEDY